MIKAFLFDLNGTMINDMQYHISAWHGILNQLGYNISLEETKHQCYGKNDELLERIFPQRFTLAEKESMSLEKEKAYQDTYKPHLGLIDGLEHFLQKSKQRNIKMAIGSAAIMFNIDFVLDNLEVRKYFDVIVSADDVAISKPSPETYLQCAAKLGMTASECLVFEDVPKGVESAAAAGMKCVLVEGIHHHESEFAQFNNIVASIKSYDELDIDELLR